MTILTGSEPTGGATAVGQGLSCRLCGSSRLHTFVDLGATPPCERFLAAGELDDSELTYPLHVRVCADCLLAQLPPLITPEDTFTEYAYFSSFSDSWVAHAEHFVADAARRLGLGSDSFVVEVASNDGYLLQHVVRRGIRCLGIEPSVNVGEAARGREVATLTAFLSPETARSVRSAHGPADLVVANNVYAHIPDVVGFTHGLRELVADDGWVSIEVQHLLTLVRHTQFDTIYHEHFQYYTVGTAQRALASGGLRLVDVELLGTHGGSIRLWARPAEVAGEPSLAVTSVLAEEQAAGLSTVAGHAGFATAVHRVRADLL
ncbi:MAG: methyltransferase domain-containing protein, partial [Pseudonocardiaceae bacterium]